MKKILFLFVLAALCLTSCHKEEYVKVEFSGYGSLDISETNIIEVEPNSLVEITAMIYTNVHPGPIVYWNKYNEPLQLLDDNYFIGVRTDQNGDDFQCCERYEFFFSDTIYHSGDHYVLSLRFGENGEKEGARLHVIIK